MGKPQRAAKNQTSFKNKIFVLLLLSVGVGLEKNYDS